MYNDEDAPRAWLNCSSTLRSSGQRPSSGHDARAMRGRRGCAWMGATPRPLQLPGTVCSCASLASSRTCWWCWTELPAARVAGQRRRTAQHACGGQTASASTTISSTGRQYRSRQSTVPGGQSLRSRLDSASQHKDGLPSPPTASFARHGEAGAKAESLLAVGYVFFDVHIRSHKSMCCIAVLGKLEALRPPGSP